MPTTHFCSRSAWHAPLRHTAEPAHSTAPAKPRAHCYVGQPRVRAGHTDLRSSGIYTYQGIRTSLLHSASSSTSSAAARPAAGRAAARSTARARHARACVLQATRRRDEQLARGASDRPPRGSRRTCVLSPSFYSAPQHDNGSAGHDQFSVGAQPVVQGSSVGCTAAEARAGRAPVSEPCRSVFSRGWCWRGC